MSSGRIIGFSTKGAGSNEEGRIRALLSRHNVEIFPFNRSRKLHSALDLLRLVRRERPDLLVMEGTGLAGGLACMLARLLLRTRYVVSSGDAVAPFIRGRSLLAWPAFALYERLLCRGADGFIGWTPYLVGRALSFGTPRGMTAAGWCNFPEVENLPDYLLRRRREIRAQLGIADTTIVIGIAGWLYWSPGVNYCYGYDLVRAIERIERNDVAVLIVGSGTGEQRLKTLAGARLGKSVFFTGEVPGAAVPEYLAAMDVGSLPQSVDGVGSFRYTTKISEYLATRLPFITNQIPMSYDFGQDWHWRLPGDAPWKPAYLDALAQWMRDVNWEAIRIKRDLIPAQIPLFDRERQIAATTDFLGDLLQRNSKSAAPAVGGHP